DGIRDRNVTGVQTCALPISVYTGGGRGLKGMPGGHAGIQLRRWHDSGFELSILPQTPHPVDQRSSFQQRLLDGAAGIGKQWNQKIGRASCREREKTEEVIAA